MQDYENTPEMRLRFMKIREAPGLSQRQMPRKMGLSYSFYGKLETGEGKFNGHLAVCICSIFGVRSNYLLKGELPMFDEEAAGTKKPLSLIFFYFGSVHPFFLQAFRYGKDIHALNGNAPAFARRLPRKGIPYRKELVGFRKAVALQKGDEAAGRRGIQIHQFILLNKYFLMAEMRGDCELRDPVFQQDLAI